MNVNAISFGKIMKVRASLDVAEEISRLANSKSKSSVARQIRAIFPDIQYGRLRPYQDSFGDVFLLSGADSQIMDELSLGMQMAKDSAQKSQDDENAIIKSERASKQYKHDMNSLVQNNKTNSVLYPHYKINITNVNTWIA